MEKSLGNYLAADIKGFELITYATASIVAAAHKKTTSWSIYSIILSQL